MKVFNALSTGLRNVNTTKRYIVLVYILNLFVALVFGFAIAETLQDSFGSSLSGDNMKQGFDDLWYRSNAPSSSGLASSFDPSVVGIGAVFNGLDAFLQGNILGGYKGIVGAGLLYLLMTTFFAAGFIAQYAAGEERPSFLQQAARFFPRFVVLTIISAILYILMFKFVFNWFTDAVDAMTRETIDERVHFTYTLIKYIIFWFLIWCINLLFDYSKILVVLKDFKNPFRALSKALKVVFGRFHKTFGLYLVIGILWIVLMLIFWLIVPEAAGSSWFMIILAFFLGQLFLISRIWTRCLFYAGQTAMCSALSAD